MAQETFGVSRHRRRDLDQDRFLKDGNKELVELKGVGSQFVAKGFHAKAKRNYTWNADLATAVLTLVTVEQLNGFLEELVKLAQKRGYVLCNAKGEPIATWKRTSLAGEKPARTKSTATWDAGSVAAGWAEKIKKEIEAGNLPTEPGRNEALYRKACKLHEDGVGLEDALTILTPWGEQCPGDEPLTAAEIEVTIRSAYNGAQNAPGSKHIDVVFGHINGEDHSGSAPDPETPEEPVEAEAKPKLSRFRAVPETEMDLTPSTQWLIPKLIPEAATVLMVGETGSFKSFLAQMTALGVSTGIEVFGHKPESGPVFYAALEGLSGIKGDRRRAWKLANGITEPLSNFFAMAAPLIDNHAECQEFMDEIERVTKRPRLIVLETVSKMMAGLNENSAQDVGKLTHFCDTLVRHFGCAVLAVHHRSDKPGAADIRGSSALKAGFDVVLEVSADGRARVATVRCTKQKDDAEPDPWAFQGQLVGPSLVFSPCRVPRRPRPEDEAAGHAVQIEMALRHQLGAIGLDKALPLDPFAKHLAGPVGDYESENDWLVAVDAWKRRLDNGSRAKKETQRHSDACTVRSLV